MVQTVLQPKATEIFSGTAEQAVRIRSERRRSNRQNKVSPQLLSLLRTADNATFETDIVEVPERLSALLAIMVISSCSAALWFAAICTVRWLLG